MCNVLFATPALLMMAMKDIDHHELFAQVLGTVCIAGLIGALVCSAMIKLQS